MSGMQNTDLQNMLRSSTINCNTAPPQSQPWNPVKICCLRYAPVSNFNALIKIFHFGSSNANAGCTKIYFSLLLLSLIHKETHVNKILLSNAGKILGEAEVYPKFPFLHNNGQ